MFVGGKLKLAIVCRDFKLLNLSVILDTGWSGISVKCQEELLLGSALRHEIHPGSDDFFFLLLSHKDFLFVAVFLIKINSLRSSEQNKTRTDR